MKSEQQLVGWWLFVVFVVITVLISFVVVVASGRPIKCMIPGVILCVGLEIVIWVIGRPHENDFDRDP